MADVSGYFELSNQNIDLFQKQQEINILSKARLFTRHLQNVLTVNANPNDAMATVTLTRAASKNIRRSRELCIAATNWTFIQTPAIKKMVR